MTDGTATNIEAPTPMAYSLSVADFQNPNIEIASFHNGDAITRSNFIPFLINSFAIGMGMADAQYTYLKWVRMNQGFNEGEAVKNLFLAGGKNVLSDQEKKAVVDAYNQVRVHEEGGIEYTVFAFLDSLKLTIEPKNFLELGPLERMPFKDLVSKIKAERDRRDTNG